MTYHADACSHVCVGLTDVVIAVSGHGLNLVQQLVCSAVSCRLQTLLQGCCTYQVQPCVHLIAAQVPDRPDAR